MMILYHNRRYATPGPREAVKVFIDMFPDLQVTVDNKIVAGDMKATKDSWKGTIGASKKAVAGETMHVFRIVKSNITDECSNGWIGWKDYDLYFDRHSL